MLLMVMREKRLFGTVQGILLYRISMLIIFTKHHKFSQIQGRIPSNGELPEPSASDTPLWSDSIWLRWGLSCHCRDPNPGELEGVLTSGQSEMVHTISQLNVPVVRGTIRRASGAVVVRFCFSRRGPATLAIGQWLRPAMHPTYPVYPVNTSFYRLMMMTALKEFWIQKE